MRVRPTTAIQDRLNAIDRAAAAHAAVVRDAARLKGATKDEADIAANFAHADKFKEMVKEYEKP